MIVNRLAVSLLLLFPALAAADDQQTANKVELQPLAAQARRVVDALDLLGSPLPAADKSALSAATDVQAIQAVLDKHCLAEVTIRPGKAVDKPDFSAKVGAAKAELAEQGWRVFLVKVHNPGGVDGMELRADSPNSLPLTRT